MIYQTNNEFKVIPFKALVNDEEFFILNKEEFEENLKQSLAMEQNVEINEVTLPIINYTDVLLAEDQEKRFNEIKNIQEISLDEARDYVISNKTGNSLAFKTFLLEKDNADLWFMIMNKEV